MQSGFRESSIRLTNGNDWPILISIPKKAMDQRVPMVLALHWGVSTNQYHEFMNCLMLPSIDTSKYIVIAPLAEYSPWWEEPKENQVVRLIDLTREYWPVSKVIIAGYSDGGTGAAHFAAEHSDQIDGAIAMAGYYRHASYSVPTYVIHGVKDQLFSYSQSKAIMDRNKQKSDQLMFVHSESLSHFEACNYVLLLKEGFEWIEKKLAID